MAVETANNPAVTERQNQEKLSNGITHAEKISVSATQEEKVNETVYQIQEQWHSQRRHLRVIHVGAGAAGLLTAYKMQKSFQDYSLVCYEKNPEVGGTWYENRYPGCACDV
jgi:heterodisulfide reductase subunit A-like polyferredoxin